MYLFRRVILPLCLVAGLGTALQALADPSATLTGSIAAPVAKHRANTVIYVKQGPPAPHTLKPAKMDQRGLVFTPRVLPLQKGATVEFLNSDTVAHSVFTLDGEKYDLGTWPQGQSRQYTFKKAGTYRQLCRVHDDMIAFIVVLDTPWFAVTDKAGQFTLSGLPAGTYTLGVWHEKLAAPDFQVTLAAGQSAKVDVALKAK